MLQTGTMADKSFAVPTRCGDHQPDAFGSLPAGIADPPSLVS